jgi:hypothetical protein
MSSEDAELFRLEDFESIRVQVKLMNHTSKTGAGGRTISFGDVNVARDPALINIRLIEFQEKGLSLEVPAKVAAMGHIVDCELEVVGSNPPLCFSVRGKVLEVTPLEDLRERLDLELLDEDCHSFEALKGLYRQRQHEIDDFFRRVKAGA